MFSWGPEVIAKLIVSMPKVLGAILDPKEHSQQNSYTCQKLKQPKFLTITQWIIYTTENYTGINIDEL